MESERQKAQYVGTEIDGKWWKSYRTDGFLMRGNGHYWLEANALTFHRLLTKEPLRIPFEVITGARIGSRHAGKWLVGSPIVKIDWTSPDGVRLTSGIGMRHRSDADALVAELQRQIAGQTRDAGSASDCRPQE